MKDPQKEEANRYQRLYDHMSQEHSLNLTIGEMDDIIAEVEKIQKEYKYCNCSQAKGTNWDVDGFLYCVECQKYIK